MKSHSNDKILLKSYLNLAIQLLYYSEILKYNWNCFLKIYFTFKDYTGFHWKLQWSLIFRIILIAVHWTLEILLKSYWNHIESSLKYIWNLIETTLKTYWNLFEISLKYHWNLIKITLTSHSPLQISLKFYLNLKSWNLYEISTQRNNLH